MKHIELFAGCGGMSLGMKSAGFELYFANELSPMAAETFAYNLLGIDLRKVQSQSKVIWLKSNYSRSEIEARLCENPFQAAKGAFSDLKPKLSFKGKLVVGDVASLVNYLNNNQAALKKLRTQNIDLLSGGPPCQSFSLAGKREKNNSKNQLPLTFAKFSGLVKPKVVLLENVKGILNPFTEDGEKYYAWLEVAKAFALEGFVPISMLLNSKYFGVAQDRNRYIMLAIRYDVLNQFKKKDGAKDAVLANSLKFYKKARANRTNLKSVTVKDLNYYPIDQFHHYYDGVLFPKITTSDCQFVSAADAISSIEHTHIDHEIDYMGECYSSALNRKFEAPIKGTAKTVMNHAARNHNETVKRRFRFYQVVSTLKPDYRVAAIALIQGKEIGSAKKKKLLSELTNHDLYLSEERAYKKIKCVKALDLYIKGIESKKNSQRSLVTGLPAPAQLTIPDDLCHYAMNQLRTMTVREMARFQSFPDWFEFKSKVTTGGDMRKYEVPQYTQVGNAVPPLLAKALGDCVKNLLK